MTDLNDLFKVIAEGKKQYEETDPVGKKLKEVKDNVKVDLGALFSQLTTLKEDLEKELVEEEAKLVSLIDEDKLKRDAKNIVNEVFGQARQDQIINEISTLVAEETLTEEIPYQPVIHTPEVRAAQVNADVDKYLTDKSFQQPNPDIVSKNIDDIRNKIKFLEQAIGRIAAHGPGGGEVNLRWLDDVDRSTITDGWYLRYNDTKKKFEFAEVISSGGNGATGATGIQGPQGATGLTGATGVGLNGASGVQGASGSTGIDGASGATGIQGASGIGATGLTGATGPQGSPGSGGAIANYGSFYDSTDQIAATINTAYAIPLGNTAEAVGTSIVDGTKVKVDYQGVYNIQFSLQLHNRGGAGSGTTVEIWLNKNGTPIVDSATKVDVDTNSPWSVPAWNFMLTLQANDYVELMWSTTNTSIVIEHNTATAPAPAIPSTILTIQQVMYTQVGATGYTGATGTQGIQGASGLQGASGVGATGITGASGLQGASGINGASGTIGVNGASGATGIQGASGATGAQGIQGASGSTGLTGATGPTPTFGSVNYAQTFGASGFSGATGATGVVFSATAFTGTGSPIEVTVCGDANPLANGAWCRLQLYRDSTAIGLPIQAESSASNENIPYAFHVIDNPGAGTFTYSLRVTASAGGGFQFGEAGTGTFTVKELSNVRGATGVQGASGVSIPAWTSNGAVTFGATTTAPTKGGTVTRDNMSYRQVGAKEWEVSLTYYQTSATGGANGSGDYLFTLPNSLSFDTTVPTQVQYQSNINTSSWYLATYVIPGANGMISNGSTGGRLFPIVYNATQFRVLTINDSAWVKCFGSGHFQLADNAYVTLQMVFRFTST